MLISWSRDIYGNTTWRLWGIKITLKRIAAFFIFCAVVGGAQAITKPTASTYSGVDAGCTSAYPVARGGYCYQR